MINAPPLSLYIHFPWCVKKCPYCDFNSHPLQQELDQTKYIQALINDLDYELSQFDQSRPLGSIFLGGGTPSLFEPDALVSLLGCIEHRLKFAEDIEITMEANPGTTEHHDFASYNRAGINRLSIGAQSFNPAHLEVLGRIHSSADILKSFKSARKGGFKNINIDLMYGLPGQTVEQALADLDTALDLAPEHISLYQLTLEPNTVFYRYPPRLPDQDEVIEMQQSLQTKLFYQGFRQYEISAYARNQYECRHNLNYWMFGDYLGIGAGAHSKLTVGQFLIRRARKKHPGTYMASAGTNGAIAEAKQIPSDEITLEFLMNGLRLKAGFSLGIAEERTGLESTTIRVPLEKHIAEGLIIESDGNLRCSERGYLFLDNILLDLV